MTKNRDASIDRTAPVPRSGAQQLARIGAVLLVALQLLAAADYPPVAKAADQAALGLGIQRTMTLLATSTPQHRNHVKVLFYGQSITEQPWSKLVADDLRKRFPDADLEIANRAIGGFSSQRLIKPAEHDLYPFYPDLVIFHVYGSNGEYEQIIRSIRSRTTAEVLMQTDHATTWPAEVQDDQQLRALDKSDHGAWWDHMMNHVFLPDYAKRYGCGLCDVRSAWVRYLREHQLEPKALLKDGVHLNEHGCAVMAGIISQYLVHRPDLPAPAETVRDLRPGAGLKADGGALRAEFDGNRIDVVVGAPPKPVAATVTIDGKPPSQFPGCYAITRPAPGPWSPLFVMRVDHDQPLLVEDWTLTITSVAADGKSWGFSVAGSVTGPDGSGDSSAPFASPSGRVKIAADSWFRGPASLAPGYAITWKVVPLHADRLELAAGDPTREQLVTIAQGLPNAHHTVAIEVAGDAATAIRALRVYQPPVPAP
jgi:hypothetical protein